MCTGVQRGWYQTWLAGCGTREREVRSSTAIEPRGPCGTAERVEMLRELFLSAASASVVVAAVAGLNDQAKQSVAGVLRVDVLTDFSSVGIRALGLARMVSETVGSYTGDHMALVGFGIGAVVLLGLMIRA